MDLTREKTEVPILSLDRVSYDYQEEICALSDITLGVGEGERFAIIGANGTGKTTLLQMMNGLIHPSRGKLFFKGYEISKQTLKDKGFLRFFRERVGFVFQDSDVQLFCPTVLDELLYGPLQLDIDEKEALDRAFEAMKMLNLENFKDRPSYMLSGGEKKKVAIGSVLTMNPEVLLLDEPTDGLDPKTQCFLRVDACPERSRENPGYRNPRPFAGGRTAGNCRHSFRGTSPGKNRQGR
jgi:cobalt/nickel transport system ATP-binding protein